jgi:hypothetical protein
VRQPLVDGPLGRKARARYISTTSQPRAHFEPNFQLYPDRERVHAHQSYCRRILVPTVQPSEFVGENCDAVSGLCVGRRCGGSGNIGGAGGLRRSAEASQVRTSKSFDLGIAPVTSEIRRRRPGLQRRLQLRAWRIVGPCVTRHRSCQATSLSSGTSSPYCELDTPRRLACSRSFAAARGCFF